MDIFTIPIRFGKADLFILLGELKALFQLTPEEKEKLQGILTKMGMPEKIK